MVVEGLVFLSIWESEYRDLVRVLLIREEGSDSCRILLGGFVIYIIGV